MAVKFNGLTDYYRADLVSFPSAYPVTFACWVKDNGSTSSLDLLIPMAFSDIDGSTAIYINFASYWISGSTRHVKFALRNVAATESSAIADNAVTVGQWEHLCGVANASQDMRIYVNGTKDKHTGGSVQTFPSSCDTFRIGVLERSSGFNYYYKDEIAEVAIWTAALDDNDADSLASGVSPRFVRPDALVFYHPLWRPA